MLSGCKILIGVCVCVYICGERYVFFPETGFAPCKIYNRYALKPGDRFRGPAVIEERESTAVAGPDTTVSVDEHLNLIIDIDPPTEEGKD